MIEEGNKIAPVLATLPANELLREKNYNPNRNLVFTLTKLTAKQPAGQNPSKHETTQQFGK